MVFPPFRLDLLDERLWKNDQEVRLRRKPFAILSYLALHPRRLVTHAELVEAVWGKTAMSESLLRTHVRDIRRVIGYPAIETVAGRGYRFAAAVAPTDLPLHASVPGDEVEHLLAMIAKVFADPRLGAALRRAAMGNNSARLDASSHAQWRPGTETVVTLR
jgi:DNA-binding winged helix-turn-helix (wHTH) protein